MNENLDKLQYNYKELGLKIKYNFSLKKDIISTDYVIIDFKKTRALTKTKKGKKEFEKITLKNTNFLNMSTSLAHKKQSIFSCFKFKK